MSEKQTRNTELTCFQIIIIVLLYNNKKFGHTLHLSRILIHTKYSYEGRGTTCTFQDIIVPVWVSIYEK